MTTGTTLSEARQLALVSPTSPLADPLPNATSPTNEPIFQPVSNPSNPSQSPLAHQNQGFIPIEPKSPNFQTNPFPLRFPACLPSIHSFSSPARLPSDNP
jgi:hypothetical protein